jgi:hypothetical protein
MQILTGISETHKRLIENLRTEKSVRVTGFLKAVENLVHSFGLADSDRDLADDEFYDLLKFVLKKLRPDAYDICGRCVIVFEVSVSTHPIKDMRKYRDLACLLDSVGLELVGCSVVGMGVLKWYSWVEIAFGLHTAEEFTNEPSH